MLIVTSVLSVGWSKRTPAGTTPSKYILASHTLLVPLSDAVNLEHVSFLLPGSRSIEPCREGKWPSRETLSKSQAPTLACSGSREDGWNKAITLSRLLVGRQIYIDKEHWEHWRGVRLEDRALETKTTVTKLKRHWRVFFLFCSSLCYNHNRPAWDYKTGNTLSDNWSI